MMIAAMAEIANQAGKEVWPSLADASHWFDRASDVLWVSLLFGFAATVAIVWLGNVKEHHWDLLREQASERIAALGLETARANAELEKAKAEIAIAQKETAIARLATESLRQRLVWRMIDPEPQRRIADSLRPFAPQAFTFALYRADDPEASNLQESIRAALEAAGWQYVSVPAKPLLSEEGLWLEWANSSGGQIAAAKDALAMALKDNAGVPPTKYSSSDKFEGFGLLIVIGVGKKPPSPMELPVTLPPEGATK